MERESRKELLTVAAALAAVMLFGTAGYIIIEGWDILDALYMTVITLATIGYGETHPLSTHGRVFTLVLIFGGIGIVAYSFSTITALFIGGHLTNAFRRKKMENKIRALESHYIVCGISPAGLSITDELKKTDRPFVIVDSNPGKIQELMNKGALVIGGDATEDEVLKKAGVEKARGVFCCLKSDKDNAFIALTARMLNARIRIITAQSTDDVKAKLIRSGADAVINPGHIGGLRMVSEMVRPTTVGFLDSMMRDARSNYRFEDVKIPPDSSVSLEGFKGESGGTALVVAIKTPESEIYEMNPSPETKLKGGEVLVALGTREQIQALRKKIGSPQ